MSTERFPFKLDVLRGSRILIADDVEVERMLLATYLQHHGCHVYLASDGQDCLRKAQLFRPDLILMDVRMPVCDGLSACRIMQDDPLTRGIPVIFLTGATTSAQRVRGLLAGAVDYIGKPFDPDEVILRLAVHLRSRANHAADGGQALPAGVSKLDSILFQSARMYLLRSLADTPDLRQLAAMVRTNSKRLNEAFRKCVGVTVFEYLREERMKQACVLLAETGLEVRIIGQEVGFTSGANFATAFKERFGVSPTQFRQTCLAKDIGETV